MGDWDGDGRDQIGILRGSIWAFDSNGDFSWQAGIDQGAGFGIPGDVPVPGDWNGDGRDEIAIFRPPNIWSIDLNGNNVWDQVPPDDGIFFANGDGVPVTGDWDGVGGDSAGMFTGAFWSFDLNGNGRWDGCNRPPVAENDSADTVQGVEVLIEVLNNDFDPDGDVLSLPPNTTVSGPTFGSAGRISSTVMRYTPTASFVGIDSFEYRVHDPSGAEDIARVWVTVSAPTEPEITSIGPDVIPHQSVTRVTVTGVNFDNPTVYVGTESPTVAGRVFPTATLLSVNAAGTSMEVNLDATTQGVEGWYTLYVETASGGIAGIFRVVPDGPVVDAWTPVEAAGGNTYVLTILGANLEGATVTPTDPNVHVLDLDNSDSEALEGLLFVDDGAPIGDGDLVIHGGGGGVNIPLAVLADPQSATVLTREIVGISTSVDLSADAGTKEESAPSGPPILMQQLSYAPGVQKEEPQVTTGKLSSQAARMSNGCFTLRITRSRSGSRTLVRLFNQDTGQPLTQAALNALNVGDRINLGATVLFFWRKWVGIAEISYCINGGVDGSVCISGEIGVMIPFVGGQVFRFDACFGTGGPPLVTLSASGSILNFEWRSDCSCVTVFDLFPSSPSGNRSAVLDVEECLEAGLSVIANGTVFNPPDQITIQINGEIARFDATSCVPVCSDEDTDGSLGGGQPIAGVAAPDLPRAGSCSVFPTAPGRLLFKFCSMTFLQNVLVIPEDMNQPFVVPTSNETWYEADGMWQRSHTPCHQWFKVPNHCDATVLCDGTATGWTWDDCCATCAVPFKGRSRMSEDPHPKGTPFCQQ